MTRITLDIDADQMCLWISDELKQCYIDHATCWKHEPDHEKLSDALLTVIEHYSVQSEFNEWYESIKEL